MRAPLRSRVARIIKRARALRHGSLARRCARARIADASRRALISRDIITTSSAHSTQNIRTQRDIASDARISSDIIARIFIGGIALISIGMDLRTIARHQAATPARRGSMDLRWLSISRLARRNRSRCGSIDAVK